MKKSLDLLPPVNLAPYTLTTYAGRAHWFRSSPVYTEVFRTLYDARETRTLILDTHPAYDVEITDARGEVIE